MTATPTYLLLGQLSREFLVTAQGKMHLDRPGGNLLYAGGGISIWQNDEAVGFVSRVGENYPRKWLQIFQEYGFNTEGVKILPEEIDHRELLIYTSLRDRATDEPIKHFARMEMSFPKALLGYQDTDNLSRAIDKALPTTLRQGDIPESFGYASAAHLSPLDFLSHSLMPAALRQLNINTITVDPSKSYMHSDYYDHIGEILTGLTAFIPSDQEVLSLFRGKSEDLWEIAETLGTMGCEFIIITLGSGGQLLYISATGEKYEIPAYPSRLVDITGAGDAFAGGFLAGFKKTYDPVQAVMYGNVSASFTVEGSGAFFLRNMLPGLHQARLETLPEMITRV